jgi:hypothetical protein
MHLCFDVPFYGLLFEACMGKLTDFCVVCY